MAHERLRPHYIFDETKIEQLKQIAPECFEDGKINFETLRQNVGDWSQNEEDPELEHFGLFWPGKRDARKAASLPPEGNLEPIWGDGLNTDGTVDKNGTNDSKNVFIEGENLEVLKLLQKSYTAKIKMIYIDPPYNTGNDFVYDDDFTEPLQEYLRRTGQIDDEGKPSSTNKRSYGRFHSKWLSMIYPRLRLARNLLKEDGMIFVSIDDSEVQNLRLVMNEIFGEENFIETIIWKKRYGGGAKEKYLVSLHEYVLVFAKNKESVNPIFIPNKQESIERYYKSKDKHFEKRGGYRTHPLEATKSMGERKNLVYPIPGPDGIDIYPKRQWLWSKERALAAAANDELEFMKDKNGSYSVNTKQYLIDEEGNVRQSKPFSVIDDVYTQHGTNEIIQLFGNAQVFSFPKPTAFLKQLLNIGLEFSDEIVLDFFAGSGSICQAIFQLNKEKEANNSFVCVQMPELLDENSDAYKLKYKKISEITKDRIRKSIDLVFKDDKKDWDCGFKSFSLTTSNYKVWKNYKGTSLKDMEQQLDVFNQSPLVENASKESLLFEIILLEGFTLCSTIDKLNDIKSNQIKKVTSEYCEHTLLVCLDDKIEKETIKNLEIVDDDIFICLDSAISTEDKLRLSDKGLIKTI